MDKQTTYETTELRGNISQRVKSYCALSELLDMYRARYVAACEKLDIDEARRNQCRIDDIDSTMEQERHQLIKIIGKAEVIKPNIIDANRTATDHAWRLIDIWQKTPEIYHGYLMRFTVKEAAK